MKKPSIPVFVQSAIHWEFPTSMDNIKKDSQTSWSILENAVVMAWLTA